MDKEIKVIEFGRFSKQADKLWTKAERVEFIDFIAKNPLSGDLVQGTGGIRKVRWTQTKRGQGKRGGTRAMYYYLAKGMTIFLLAIYGKGEKVDLTTKEKKALALVARDLKKSEV